MQEKKFSTKTKINLDEYIKFNRTIQRKINKTYLRLFISIAIILVAAVVCFLLDVKHIAIAFALAAVVLVIQIPIKMKKSEKEIYNSNKVIQDVESEISFYEDCFEQTNSLGTSKITYDKIYRILENDTNLYIMISKNQGYIIIKENCSVELIDFIKNLTPNKK